MPIDRELLVRKMKMIAEDLRALRKFSKMSLKGYLREIEHEILAERYLERLIGRMIDVNYHIVVETKRLPPKDYYESFMQLGKQKVLARDLASRLAQSAGLRNRLAHEYDEIDPAKVHAAVKSGAADIPRYLRSIQRYID
jgi:uncharacterized protein YutE (UPF0331/DUF86 family)